MFTRCKVFTRCKGVINGPVVGCSAIIPGVCHTCGPVCAITFAAWRCCVVVCRAYLSSNDVSEILSGQRQALAGIDVLRKICNHPDLLQRTQAQGSITYGEPSRCETVARTPPRQTAECAGVKLLTLRLAIPT